MSSEGFGARVTAVVIGTADVEAAQATVAGQTIAPANLEIRAVPADDWAALDTALIEADAPLIALVPAGATLHPDKLCRQAEQLEADPELALSVHPLEGGGDHRVAQWRLYSPAVAALLASPCEPGGAMFRVSAFDAVFGFRTVADPLWDWTVRVVLGGGRVGLIPEPLAGRPAGAAPGPLPPLVPAGPRHEFILKHLWGKEPADLVPRIASPADAVSLLAGLYQWHDALEESHALAQRADDLGPNPTAAYWHGIVHRREPDFANARYWFRRVGRHPVFEQLDAATAEVRRDLGWSGGWDPMKFIDLCARCVEGHAAELEQVAQRLQAIELCLLFRDTYDAATGGRKA